MYISSLNFARKWRSQTFDQVIGQELPVRMLKNSLYKSHYFPVYLFAGQHGCGKTTVARLFGAAVNCSALSFFQKTPRTVVLPCLICDSCRAMATLSHPDFIEIDAASHTGVDNVRILIESSTHLPVLGNKRIYLIDEAHMLSKAAFNAFLKILEDPPHHTLFMLATTDAHKIIDTVRSRCFQLLFKPIEHATLVAYLDSICTQELIKADQSVLDIIALVARGSVRDSLNLLEQVRFAGDVITPELVYGALGYMPYATIFELLDHVLCQETSFLIRYLKTLPWACVSSDIVWQQLIECARGLVWAVHGTILDEFASTYRAYLEKLAQKKEALAIFDLLAMFCDQERSSSKGSVQRYLIEWCLIQFSLKKNKSNNNDTTPLASSNVVAPCGTSAVHDVDDNDNSEDTISKNELNEHDTWNAYQGALKELNDPLLMSIFSNGTVRLYDQLNKFLYVDFSQDFHFFHEWITESKALWYPVFQRFFGATAELKIAFTKKPAAGTRPMSNVSHQPVVVNTVKSGTAQPVKNSVVGRWGKSIDVTNKEVWKNSHLLMKHFPGTVFEWKESL